MRKQKRLILVICTIILLISSLFVLNSCEIFCSHEESDWIIDTEPDYHNDGAKHTVCEKCGKTMQAVVIPHLVCEHADADWIVDSYASKESAGARHKLCNECGDTVENQVIPVLKYSLEEAEIQISRSLVKVYCYDFDRVTVTSQGSGFFIDEYGTFITNAHVINNAHYIKIEDYTSQVYTVSTVYAYNLTDSDYAICRADGCGSKPVEFEESVEFGDTVYAFGYPDNAEELQGSEGHILRTHIKGNGIPYVENSAEINNGSSGGALVNSSGKLVGMTTGMLANKNYAAIAYRDLKDVINAKYTDGKTPLDWFYDDVRIEINADNFQNYFE